MSLREAAWSDYMDDEERSVVCESKEKEKKTLCHDPNPVLTDLTKHRAKFQKEKKHGES